MTTSAEDTGPQTETVSFIVTMPSLTLEAEGGHSLGVMDGATQWAAAEGSPLVPAISRAVLLPSYAGEVLEMTATSDRPVDVGEAMLLPSVTGQSSNGTVDPSMRDQGVYSSYDPYPGSLCTSDGNVGLSRGLRILHLTLMPVQYIPATGELLWYDEMLVSITYTVDQPTEATGLPTTDVLLEGNLGSYQMVPTADDVDMLIITDGSMEAEFQRLAAWKGSVGIVTQVVTVDQVLSSYGGTDDQEAIRNCITEWYTDRGIDFVLLGGDDEVIPHRGMLGMASGGLYSDLDIASDLYYAGLDGDWNADGDALYGELGEEDLYAEVWVGRASVDSVAEAATFVDKVIAYESQASGTDHLDQALFLGEKLDASTWGGDFKDQVEQYSDGLDVIKLYESLGNMNKTSTFEAINSGVHLVNNMGHGNVNTVANMYSYEMYMMENDDLFIWYSQSCYSGSFDDRYSTKTYATEDCIAEQMVTAENGAVAFIGNSRYGFYYTGTDNGPSNEFDMQFFKAVCQDDIPYLGQALQVSKEALASTTSSMDATRWVYYELNLLGDPSLRIGGYGEVQEYDLVVDGDQELAETAAAMEWSGDGTFASPYQIRGLSLHLSGGVGLSLSNIDSYVMVVDCEFDGTGGTGMALMGASNVTVDGCRFIGLETGLDAQGCGGLSIDGSTFLENDVGVRIASSQDVELSGSVITRSAGMGISITGSYGVAVTGNALFDNNGADTTFSSAHPQASGYTSAVDWDGNHWSDLDAADADGDGVLDSSYATAGGGMDDAPLVDSPFPVPTLEITSPSGTGWYGAQVTVAWSADHNTGLQGFMFRDDADAWASTSQMQAVVVLEHGQNTVWVKALANDGTMARANVAVQVDLVNPTVSFISPANDALFADEAVTVEWTAYDGDSGLAQGLISLDGGAWETVTGVSRTYSGLSPGDHELILRVSDQVGNTAEDSLTITIDALAPSLAITSPVQGSVLSSSSATIVWSVYDVSGVGSCKVRMDDGTWIDRTDGSSQTFYDLSEGEHTVFLSAIDLAGNEATAQLTFSVDTLSPSLAILTPAQGAMVNTSSVTMSWTGSDPGTGVQGYMMSVDGGQWIDLGLVEYHTLTLPEGDHQASVKAIDTAGNYMTVTRSFIVDLSPPVLTIDAPYDGQLISSDDLEVSWTASDTLSGIASYLLSLDGGEWSAQGTSRAISLSGLEDGEHSIMVRATDGAGNHADAVVTVIVVTAGPDVTITSPEAGALEMDGDLLVTWTSNTTSEDLDHFMVRLDDGSWQDEGQATSATLQVEGDGQHTVFVMVIDTSGRSATASRSIMLDTLAPWVEITSPLDGQYSALPCSVTWVMGDLGSGTTNVQIALDGGSWQDVGDVTAWELPNMEDGDHSIDVRVFDAAGRSSSTSSGFHVDTHSPVFDSTSPVEGAVIGSDSLYVGWEVSDPSPLDLQMSVDGGDWYPIDGNITYLEGLDDGHHTISLAAVDAAGNRAEIWLNLTVDTTPPSLGITYPQPGSGVGTDVYVAWEAWDESSWVESSSLLLDGHYVDVIPGSNGCLISNLSLGWHQIVVEVIDAAGMNTTANVEFEVIDLEVKLYLNGPDGGMTGPTATINWTLFIEGVQAQIDSASLSLDDGPWVPLGAVEAWSITMDEGEHEVKVTATSDGVSATATLVLSVDASPPSLWFTKPAEGDPLNSTSVEVGWTVENGTSVQISVDGGSWASAEGEGTLLDLQEGLHKVSLRAFDEWGNMVETNITFIVDITAPSFWIGLDEGERVNASHPGLDWKAEDALSGVGTVSVRIDDGDWFTAGPELDIVVDDGDHVLQIRVTDLAGNVLSAMVNYTVDTIAPELSLDVEGAIYDDDALVGWGVLNDLPATVALELSLDGGDWMQVQGNGTLLEALTPGEHWVTLRATDIAGNVGETSASLTCWYQPPSIVGSPWVLHQHSSIQLDFSEHVDLGSVSLLLDDVPVEGTIEWNGTEMSFIPSDPLPADQDAILALSCRYLDGTQAPQWTRSYHIEPCAMPSAPQNATLQQQDGGTVISWEPVNDTGGHPVIGYMVYRITADGETLLGLVDGLSTVDDGHGGVSRSYRITAVTEIGEGASLYTQVVEATDDGPILWGISAPFMALSCLLLVAGVVAVVLSRRH